MRNLTQPDLALLAFAREVQEKAYAPYSNFRVGAAIYADGEIFQGVNVENAAYSSTVCAERAALTAAVPTFPTTIPAAWFDSRAASSGVAPWAKSLLTTSRVSSPPCRRSSLPKASSRS